MIYVSQTTLKSAVSVCAQLSWRVIRKEYR